MDTLTLHGPAGDDLTPLWTAKADVLETLPLTGAKALDYAERHLYLGKRADGKVYPSVEIIRARIQEPRLHFFQPAIGKEGVLPGFQNDTDLKHHNVTLLVSAPQASSKVVNVLAGEIHIDAMAAQPWLPGKEWSALFPMFSSVCKVRLCRSGLIFEAHAQVPWQAQAVHGQFLAMMRVWQPAKPGLSKGCAQLHVSLEHDERHLPLAARSVWQQSFTALGQALQPSTNRPQWAALKLHLDEHAGLPPFHWDVNLKRPTEPKPWKLDKQMFAFDKGAVSLLLTDHWPEPETLGKVLPNQVTVATDKGIISLEFESGSEIKDKPTTWIWNARREDAHWKESSQLAPGSTAALDVDAIALAQTLREEIGEPALEDVLSPPDDDQDSLLGAPLAKPEPLLWMNLPLADGWAQLPYFNLTPTTYIDAKLPAPPKAAPREALMQGAWRLHANPDVITRMNHGAPDWSVTVLDARRVKASFKLDAKLKLVGGEIILEQPQFSVAGLWSRSREPGTVQDMLPEHADWVGGLVPLVMRTPDPVDLTPSPYHFAFSALAIEASGGWPQSPAWAMEVKPWDKLKYAQLLKHLEENRVFDMPGVWRRHPVQPLVAALSLTSNEMPPAHPALSRELMPFALPSVNDLGWSFARGLNDLWPTSSKTLKLEPAWSDTAPELLPMVAPMFPGLVVAEFTASEGVPDDGSKLGLRAALRWDMPVMDERHALAVTPPLAEEKGEVPPTPKGEDHAAKPLRRRDLQDWWGRQRMRAVYARADAREMFMVDGTEAWLVNHLVEPLTWKPKNPSLSLKLYPGVAEMDGRKMTFALADPSALEGISGRFKEGANGTLDRTKDEGWEVHAGAANALPADQRLHDQRGLTRAAPEWTPAAKTLVGLREDANTRLDRTLWTPLAALQLTVGKDKWLFWCRDLPLKSVSSQWVFERPNTVVNDPALLTREQAWLQTREWRLASASPPMKLLGLRVHGLQLSKLVVSADDTLKEMEVLARLQLPLAPAKEADPEQPHRQNTVTLVFDSKGLADVRLAKDHVLDWPLNTSETPPHVTVGELNFDRNAQTLKLGQVFTHFSLLGQNWHLQMQPATLRGDQPCELTWTPASIDQPLAAKEVKVVLHHHDDSKHALHATLRFCWGVTRLEADMTCDVLGDHWTCEGGLLAGGTRNTRFSAESEQAITAQHMRMTFGLIVQETLDALPGMRVPKVGSSGCAAMSYMLTGQNQGAPTFDVTTAFMELLLPCEWGAEFKDSLPTADALCSSRGAVSVNYTLSFAKKDNAWKPAMLLNGQLTLRSLMSWPVDMLKQPKQPDLRRLYFDEGSSAVSDADNAELKVFADWMLEDRNALLRIEGHASADDSDAVNEEFARDRAKATLAALLTHVPARNQPDVTRRIELIGWGERRAGEHPRGGVPDRKHPDRLAVVQARPCAVLPSATAERHDHLSHEMTILFNQHLMAGSAELIGAAKLTEKHAVLFPASSKSAPWNFVAITEHQLRELGQVDEAGWHHQPSATRRWTACQELRLLTPECMKTFVLAVHGLKVAATGTALSDQASAHLAHPVLDALAANHHAVCGDLPGFWIEASAPFWVRPVVGERKRWTTLQSLPGFEQQAIMARLQDYQPHASNDPGWQLVVLPFLGRLQPQMFDAPRDKTKPTLAADPLWQVMQWKDQSTPLARMFASRGGGAEVRVPLPALTLPGDVNWPRLEPEAIADSWLRLQVLPDEQPLVGSDKFAPVLASLPAASAARVTRMTAMAGLLSPRATRRPPGDEAAAADPPGTLPFWWRPGHLLAYQGPPPTKLLEHPMVVAGAAVLQLNHPVRDYVAATVLAAQPTTDSPQPLPLAISPCLRLRPSQPTGAELRAVYAELITQPEGSPLPNVTAMRLWTEVTESSANGLIMRWAEEMRLTTVPPGAWWLVRVRKVLSESDANDANEDLVAIIEPGFSLGSSPPLHASAPLSPLRAADPLHREYQASLQPPPQCDDIADPWEVAGMLTAGVQSVWRAHDKKSPTGLSATRYVMHLADQDPDQPGGFLPHEGKPARRWWLTLGERVQYFHDKARKTLPNDFSGQAIPLLTPVADDGQWEPAAPNHDATLHPLMPTAMAVVITGRRPGVFRALRPHLATQVADATLPRVFTSAGPLVQHRFPRGLPLPADWQPKAHAHSDENCRVLRSPCDSVTFTLLSDMPAQTLDFTAELKIAGNNTASPLQNSLLQHGILAPTWNGELLFEVVLRGDKKPDGLTFEAQCIVADQQVNATAEYAVSQPLKLTFGSKDNPVARLKDWQAKVKSLPHGSAVTIAVTCAQPFPALTERYRKSMTFHLRLAQPEFSLVPLSRMAVHFEDPAYNRHLSSPPAQDECALRAPKKNAQAMLATDRRQYNANSTLLFGLRVADPEPPQTPKPFWWQLERASSDGSFQLLKPAERTTSGDTLSLDLGRYLLKPGDTLALSATDTKPGDNLPPDWLPRPLRIELPIVSQPVIPTPEAAYAAIMFNDDKATTASCPRFAWSPMPQRIELLDSQDLFKNIVRRAASFRWWVPVRSDLNPLIRVQRTDALGNTHSIDPTPPSP